MYTTTEMDRRSFIRRSGTVATAFAAPYFIPSGVLARDGKPGANDRIGIAVIGPGRQGSGLLGSAGNSPQARIVAIADVNLPRAQQMAAKYQAAVYKDYRELLERKDVDAVITATPEHWRALTCIHACQAGKDIYAQKPIADVEIGHRSATVCHLGNIARWTGHRLHWDPVKERFEEDAANQHLDRARRKPYELPASI